MIEWIGRLLMGTFHHTITVSPKDGSQRLDLDALVDTVSTYTMIPAPELEALGVTPEWTSVFELADGSRSEYRLAELQVSINGESRTTICIFGDQGSTPLLGAYTLEGFGLAADPVNGKLTPARSYLV